VTNFRIQILNYLKIWVFSQVSRFSSESPILIFESPIQSGGSSSLILEPSPSGVISSRSENPQIDVFPFFTFFVLRFIPIFVPDEFSPQIQDDPSSYGNQSSVGFSLSMFVSDFGVFPSKVRLCVIPSKGNCVALFYSHIIVNVKPLQLNLNGSSCGTIRVLHSSALEQSLLWSESCALNCSIQYPFRDNCAHIEQNLPFVFRVNCGALFFFLSEMLYFTGWNALLCWGKSFVGCGNDVGPD